MAAPRRTPRTAAALLSHVLLDLLAHEDTVSVPVQGALAAGTLGALALAWGPRSPVVLGALTATAPDGEVLVAKLLGRDGPLAFPTHWQIPSRRGMHPWHLPGRPVPLQVEICVTAAVGTLVCLLGVRAARQARAAAA